MAIKMKTIKNLLTLFVITVTIINPCFSQFEESAVYKVEGVSGVEYIFINGKKLSDYTSVNKWFTWNDVIIKNEDSVMVASSKGFLGLSKNHEFIGSLCFETSHGNYITIKKALNNLCQVNKKAQMENKGVVRLNGRITKGSVQYYDTLKYYAINSMPAPDSSVWFVENRSLKVKSYNPCSIIYDVLFETDSTFVIAGVPVRVNPNEELPYSTFPTNLNGIIHVFWRPFGEFAKVPDELDINNPVFHYSIILE